VSEDAETCDHVGVGDGDYRITLVKTTEREESARVEVIVSQVVGGGLFGPDEYQSDEVFDLRREGDGWRISTVPWAFAICSESGL
jgi:hypothetical protein